MPFQAPYQAPFAAPFQAHFRRHLQHHFRYHSRAVCNVVPGAIRTPFKGAFRHSKGTSFRCHSGTVFRRHLTSMKKTIFRCYCRLLAMPLLASLTNGENDLRFRVVWRHCTAANVASLPATLDDYIDAVLSRWMIRL